MRIETKNVLDRYSVFEIAEMPTPAQRVAEWVSEHQTPIKRMGVAGTGLSLAAWTFLNAEAAQADGPTPETLKNQVLGYMEAQTIKRKDLSPDDQQALMALGISPQQMEKGITYLERLLIHHFNRCSNGSIQAEKHDAVDPSLLLDWFLGSPMNELTADPTLKLYQKPYLGKGGVPTGDTFVFVKTLNDGSKTVGIFNPNQPLRGKSGFNPFNIGTFFKANPGEDLSKDILVGAKELTTNEAKSTARETVRNRVAKDTYDNNNSPYKNQADKCKGQGGPKPQTQEVSLPNTLPEANAVQAKALQPADEDIILVGGMGAGVVLAGTLLLFGAMFLGGRSGSKIPA